jgi:uncharacterized membrane protein
MTRAYSLARAAPVTALSGLSVVFTYLLAIPVFGDQPTAWRMVRSFLVIAASLLHEHQTGTSAVLSDGALDLCMFAIW